MRVAGPPVMCTALALWCSACSTVHRFARPSIDNCVAHGETLTLRGEIVVRPFGKGTDGAVLQVSSSEAWILSYRAEGVLLAMNGERVEITGRACAPQYQAILGDHFDIATLVGLTEP